MMRYVCLAMFSVAMMFALHPLPRDPWGVFGLGDLFFGYVLALVSGTAYVTIDLRQRRTSWERRRIAERVARTQVTRPALRRAA